MAAKFIFSSVYRIFNLSNRHVSIRRMLISGLVFTSLSAGVTAQTDDHWSSTGNNGSSSSQPGSSALQPAMSADAIINLLQQQPALLQAAKIRMAQALSVDPS